MLYCSIQYDRGLAALELLSTGVSTDSYWRQSFERLMTYCSGTSTTEPKTYPTRLYRRQSRSLTSATQYSEDSSSLSITQGIMTYTSYMTEVCKTL